MFLRLATGSCRNLFRVKPISITRSWLNFGRLPGRKNRRIGRRRLQNCRLLLLGLLLCCHPFLSGCRKAVEPVPDIIVKSEIAPQPPKVGPATVTLKLSDSSGAALNGAQVNLEGNMSHAGMRPVFGETKEIEPGLYRALIEFTMAGDWVLTIHITLPGGRQVERQVEVNAVESG